MEAILKFNMEDDEARFNRMMEADDLFHAVYHVQQELRKVYRHGEGADAEHARRWARELHEALVDNGINMDADYQ